MSFISNFDGTMKKSIQIGKKGSVLKSELGELNIQSINGTLQPLNVADPTKDSHAVTLKYFNEHNNGGTTPPASNIIIKETTPEPNEGKEGDVFYEVDNEYILNIYVKHTNKWKMFKHTPIIDEPNVKSVVISHTDFNLVDGIYVAEIPLELINKQTDIIIQSYDINGNLINASINIDGNLLKVYSNEKESIILKIIGANNMKTTYVKEFVKSDWTVIEDDDLQLTIPVTEHEQGSNLLTSVYENNNSVSALVTVNAEVKLNGDIVLYSTSSFDGKIIIYGN